MSDNPWQHGELINEGLMWERIDARFAAVETTRQAGKVTVTVTTGGTPAFVDVTFADPFEAVPIVTATAYTSGPQNTNAAVGTPPTTTGCRIWAVRPTPGPVEVGWNAQPPTQ